MYTAMQCLSSATSSQQLDVSVAEACPERTDAFSVAQPDTHPSANPVMHANSGDTGRPASATQSLCQPPLLESQGKPARQSLNFTPIKIPSQSQVESSTKGKPVAREDTGLMAVSDCTTEGTKAEPSLTLADAKESMPADKIAAKSCASADLMNTSEQPAEMDTADGKGEAEASKTMSADTTAEVTERNKTVQKADQDIRNPAPLSAENKVVEEVKSESKALPVSPTPEKASRTRTGSMHRKKRQAHSNIQTESPVQPEGDNSKDSTDSHSSTTNVTRASRSRNKQLAAAHQEDEPIPARETRRKAMMKERSAASSPSVDKSSKVGSQKVPPLTIKLGGKSQTSTSATSTAKDTHSSVASATAGGEPYVMLADKDTERANSFLAKEQAKLPDSLDSAENKEKKQDATNVTSQASTQPPLSTIGVSTRRTGLRSHTNRIQATVGEKLRDPVPPKKSRRMKAEPASVAPVPPPSLPPPPGPSTIFNPYTLFKGVREQMHKKWEKIVPVNPRTPAGYSRYIINTKKYLIHKNAATNASKLSIPLLSAPSQLAQPMKELFNKQEQERYKLSRQHLIEGEKLRIAYEQEVVRVHTRGARAAANQEIPLSVCTVLKDKESGTVYHPFNALKDGSSGPNATEEKSSEKSSRSHFNNRQLISWHQDIKDKFENLKDQMLNRHHHEADSLYAVQTMDWEWKLKEVGLCDYKAQPTIEILDVPMVQVNDDADILNS